MTICNRYLEGIVSLNQPLINLLITAKIPKAHNIEEATAALIPCETKCGTICITTVVLANC